MVRVLSGVKAVVPSVARLGFDPARIARRFRRLIASGAKLLSCPHRLLVGLACLAFAVAGAASASAQNFARADLDALYQRVLRDPKNVRLTLQYAQMAKNYGDYEAAIAAYEKLLLFNPKLPDVQYELGVLYFSLGSYAAAKSYFEKVAAIPNISRGLRDDTAAYLKEIERRLSPTRFSGYFHSGLRYQTNADFGSSAGLGQFAGQTLILQPGFVKQPDWNAFALSDLFFARDFGDRGDSFELSLSDYAAKQFQIDQVDLAAAELQFGPRLVFFPEYFSNTTTKLYGIVNGVMLGDDPYFRTFGSGISFDSKLNPVTTISTSVEYRNRQFYDSTNYPTAGQQTGDLVTGSFAARGLVYGPVHWIARVSYDWNSSDFSFWSYQRPYAEVGMPVAFDMNLFGANRSGLITPYVGGGIYRFDQPDPDFNPVLAREDRTWYVGATLETTIVGQASFRLNVNYLSNDSNIINFTYRDLSVSFGPAITF